MSADTSAADAPIDCKSRMRISFLLLCNARPRTRSRHDYHQGRGQCPADRDPAGGAAPKVYSQLLRKSVRLGTGEFDDLGPLRGFVGDEPAEVRGRAREQDAAHVGEPRLQPRFGAAGIDLPVALLDVDSGRPARPTPTLHTPAL